MLGTLLLPKVWKRPSISGLSILSVLLAMVSALCLALLKLDTPFQSGLTGQMILGLLNIITGALVGAVFALAVNLNGKSSPYDPGILFSADLTGAALGTLLPVIFLLPLIGVMNTFILLGGISVLTALRLLINARNTGDG